MSFENNVKNRNVNEQKNDDTKFISKKFKTKINFAINTNDIIYHVDIDSRRSCIFITIKRKIFRLIHDQNQHSKIHWCYDKIFNTLYIFRFSRKIKKYIEHCFICQLTQIKRHRSYEKFMFITFVSRLFHIITIDFILIMFDEMNIVMFATCKHFRRISLIFDKKIYETKKWINALLNKLLIIDWNVFEIIISNRNSKFMSNF